MTVLLWFAKTGIRVLLRSYVAEETWIEPSMSPHPLFAKTVLRVLSEALYATEARIEQCEAPNLKAIVYFQFKTKLVRYHSA